MKKLGYAAIIFTMVVWGLSYISIKIALEVFTPIGLVFFRYVFASVFFILFMKIKKESFRFDLKDLPLFLLSSLIGVVLYFYAESTGIKYLSVSSASIILSLVPLAIMLSNFLIHNERLNKIKIFTIFASIVGIYLIVSSDSGGVNSTKGYLFMILAVLSWTVFSETSSRLTKKYSELKVAATQGYIALLLYLPLIFFQGIEYSLVEAHHWIHVIALGVLSSAISFLLYVVAMKNIGTTESGLFVNFIPIVTIVFGYFILGDILTIHQVIGAFIIVSSMTLMISYDIKEVKRKNS
ncbi:DMT family transporter [Mycoplasmatota bacterium WC44]